MKTTVLLLLLLLLHLGLSSMMYRYNGIIKLKPDSDSHYQLQLCTSNTVACPADTISIEQNCSDDEATMCHMCNENITSFFNSCNMTSLRTLPTSSSDLATNNPTASPTICTATTTMISQAALGAMVGILAILLAIVSTGWVCTCWVMQKRRREMNINTTNIR